MKTTINKEIKNLIKAIKENIVPYVICPDCGRTGVSYYSNINKWACIWRDCFFKTDKIPSPYYIKGLIYLKQQLEDIKKFGI